MAAFGAGFNRGTAINAGWAVDEAWVEIASGQTGPAEGLDVHIRVAVSDTDGFLFRVSYQVTLLGRNV